MLNKIVYSDFVADETIQYNWGNFDIVVTFIVIFFNVAIIVIDLIQNRKKKI